MLPCSRFKEGKDRTSRTMGGLAGSGAGELPGAVGGCVRCGPPQLHPTSRTKSGKWGGLLARVRCAGEGADTGGRVAPHLGAVDMAPGRFRA